MPARFGRYEIVQPIAGGGMGFVYAAYDPELDRKVAIKVVHPRRSHDSGSHLRLFREARALARLDHPNVVKVHDIFSHGDQIVVVMELVEGETLASWEAAGPRRWREVLSLYIQAAKGLAAAHALDIVHRDFKPSNVVVGTDRRVRVLDFGLARLTTETAVHGDAAIVAAATGAAATGAVATGAAPVGETAPGGVVGTPAYASPEQLAGAAITTASDQYSFCLSLQRALVNPPSWLSALLRRGLASEPKARHPSMGVLIRELERPRGVRRWWLPASAALLVAIGATAAYALRGTPAAPPSCDAHDEVWAPRRAGVEGALRGIRSPYAAETAERVVGGMDQHAAALAAADRGACLAHQHGELTDALFDHAAACLDRQRATLDAAVTVLASTTATSLDHAADVVAALPSPAPCTDRAKLASDVAVPDTLAARAAVAVVRDHLAAAGALRAAQRTDEANAAIQKALAEAKSTGFAPVIAEADILAARIDFDRGDNDRASGVLHEAMTLGLANDLRAIAVEAAARHIYADGIDGKLSSAQLASEISYAEALSEGVADNHFVRALLFNNIGVAYMAVEQPETALTYFERAHGVIANDANPDLELVSVDQNLAMLDPSLERRGALLRALVDRVRSMLGAHHPLTRRLRMELAMNGSDATSALELLGQLCAELETSKPASTESRECELSQGFLASELGDHDVAQDSFTRVVEQTTGVTEAYALAGRRFALGMLELERGDTPAARSDFEAIIAERRDSAYWWVQRDAYFAELELGLAKADRSLVASAASGFARITRFNHWITCETALSHARQYLTTR